MRRLLYLLSALVLFKSGTASGDFARGGIVLHPEEGNFSEHHQAKKIQHQHHRQAIDSLPGSTFTLKVQVSDVSSRQHLSQVTVEVYVNYSSTNMAVTGEDGAVLLHVPYQLGPPIIIVASRDGYILTALPWKTNRMPIFSSVTLSLHGLNQGNIWLFEESILITSDASSQPSVQFPKSLLNLPESSNVSSVRAYMTAPNLPEEGGNSLCTMGIVSSKSGYTSIELSPVAAVSVQLFSRETELHVSGPIQITLPLPDNCGLQVSTAVPAWLFNQTTGGWMRKGLGTVSVVDGNLMWTFVAPHLGYWIAAPVSSSRGLMGRAIPIDFISYHSYFLMAILGGTLVILIGLLAVLLCYHRGSLSETKAKRIHATKMVVPRKDQTTSTYDNELLEVSSEDSRHLEDRSNQSFAERGDNQNNDTVISKHNGNVDNSEATGLGVIRLGENVAISLMCTEPCLNADTNDLTSSHDISQQIKVPLSLKDNLFFYNQPVAILHAPACFHLEEQPEQTQWSKAATLPRAGASNNTPSEPLSEDSFTQTLSKGPSVSQNQALDTEEKPGDQEGSQAPSSTNLSRGHYGLPESVSVPGTLNKIGDNRHPRLVAFPCELQGNSEHALAEISSGKTPSPLPPRAWFVSLEGKPAAEIHHTVAEQQRRRRPVESRDTSLDSGVDMSELNQSASRRVVTLERNVTFVKSSPSTKPAPTQ